MDEKQARQAICEVGKLLYHKGMIAGLEGNISCRLDDDEVVITPAARCKGRLQPQDMVLISPGGSVLGEGKPSSEFRLHLAGYNLRTDFKAAVHAHAPHLSAFALSGEDLSLAEAIPEFVANFGSIPLVPFAEPGSKELGENLAEMVSQAHTFLLERHGVVAFGSGLWEAYYRLEMAEQIAKTLILSRMLKRANSDSGVEE